MNSPDEEDQPENIVGDIESLGHDAQIMTPQKYGQRDGDSFDNEPYRSVRRAVACIVSYAVPLVLLDAQPFDHYAQMRSGMPLRLVVYIPLLAFLQLAGGVYADFMSRRQVHIAMMALVAIGSMIAGLGHLVPKLRESYVDVHGICYAMIAISVTRQVSERMAYEVAPLKAKRAVVIICVAVIYLSPFTFEAFISLWVNYKFPFQIGFILISVFTMLYAVHFCRMYISEQWHRRSETIALVKSLYNWLVVYKRYRHSLLGSDRDAKGVVNAVEEYDSQSGKAMRNLRSCLVMYVVYFFMVISLNMYYRIVHEQVESKVSEVYHIGLQYCGFALAAPVVLPAFYYFKSWSGRRGFTVMLPLAGVLMAITAVTHHFVMTANKLDTPCEYPITFLNPTAHQVDFFFRNTTTKPPITTTISARPPNTVAKAPNSTAKPPNTVTKSPNTTVHYQASTATEVPPTPLPTFDSAKYETLQPMEIKNFCGSTGIAVGAASGKTSNNYIVNPTKPDMVFIFDGSKPILVGRYNHKQDRSGLNAEHFLATDLGDGPEGNLTYRVNIHLVLEGTRNDYMKLQPKNEAFYRNVKDGNVSMAGGHYLFVTWNQNTTVHNLVPPYKFPAAYILPMEFVQGSVHALGWAHFYYNLLTLSPKQLGCVVLTFGNMVTVLSVPVGEYLGGVMLSKLLPALGWEESVMQYLVLGPIYCVLLLPATIAWIWGPKLADE